MAKITVIIENEGTGYTVGRSVKTGDTAWEDSKFFMIAVRQAAIKLSEELHIEVEPEIETWTQKTWTQKRLREMKEGR